MSSPADRLNVAGNAPVFFGPDHPELGSTIAQLSQRDCFMVNLLYPSPDRWRALLKTSARSRENPFVLNATTLQLALSFNECDRGRGLSVEDVHLVIKMYELELGMNDVARELSRALIEWRRARLKAVLR